MKTFTQKDKLQAYKLLPVAQREAVFSESIANKIQEVATANNLNTEALATLRLAVGLYILKLVNMDEVMQEVKDPFVQQDIGQKILPEIDRVLREYKPETEVGTDIEENDEISGGTKANKPIQSPYHESPSRDELLKAIEDPKEDPYREPVETAPLAQKEQAAPNPAEDRLKGMVFTPKETKQVTVDTPKRTGFVTEASITPGSAKLPMSEVMSNTPQNTVRYDAGDPYRESLDK